MLSLESMCCQASSLGSHFEREHAFVCLCRGIYVCKGYIGTQALMESTHLCTMIVHGFAVVCVLGDGGLCGGGVGRWLRCAGRDRLQQVVFRSSAISPRERTALLEPPSHNTSSCRTCKVQQLLLTTARALLNANEEPVPRGRGIREVR